MMDKNTIRKESYLNIIFSLYIVLAILYIWLNIKGFFVTAYLERPEALDDSLRNENYLLKNIIASGIATFFMSILMHFSARKLRPNAFLPIYNIVLSCIAIFFLFPIFFAAVVFGDSIDIIINEVILMIYRTLLLTDSIIMLSRYLKTAQS